MQELQPAICVVSGPSAKATNCAQALTAAGLTAVTPEGHGLSSHPDPITAHAAGAPNSGHTPGTPHPAELAFVVRKGDHEKGCTLGEDGKTRPCEHLGQTEMRPNPLTEHIGAPYEDDPDIAFLACACPDPDAVAAIVAPVGWMLRMFLAPIAHEQQPPGIEERLARLEQHAGLILPPGVQR